MFPLHEATDDVASSSTSCSRRQQLPCSADDALLKKFIAASMPPPPSATQQERIRQQAPARPRSVRFAPTCKVRIVHSHRDMNEIEVSNAWYDVREMRSVVMSEVIETVQAARKNQAAALKHPSYCLRGLEHMTSTVTFQQRETTKANVVRSVLCEQERQRANGNSILDETLIAQASVHNSRTSRQMAVTMGAMDEAFVRREVVSSTTTSDFRTRQRYLASPSNHHAKRKHAASGSNNSKFSTNLNIIGKAA